MKVTERLLVEIIQNDPKTAITFHSKRPKFMKKDAKNPITVSRVGPRWPTLDNNKRAISTFKFSYPRLTLKEGFKVKSDHTKRFSAHDFLEVGFPSQTSRTNNKQVISTFKFGYFCLTLKEGSKVKSDHTKRIQAHDFL